MVEFLSDGWLEEMTAAAARRPLAPGPQLTIQQVVGERPSITEYVIELGPDHARFRPGRADAPDLVIRQDYATAAALARGELSTSGAFMEGRIRVGGDLASAAGAGERLAGLGDVFASVRESTEY